jgi:hypothetical protein
MTAQKASFHVDSRGIVFPPASGGAEHAPPRLIVENAPVGELRGLLGSLYRFGSVVDYGFHHDAQFPNGKRLENVEFDCSRQGQIKVSSTHANVYPNDYVRSG